MFIDINQYPVLLIGDLKSSGRVALLLNGRMWFTLCVIS
jgi:hypothetical protein